MAEIVTPFGSDNKPAAVGSEVNFYGAARSEQNAKEADRFDSTRVSI